MAALLFITGSERLMSALSAYHNPPVCLLPTLAEGSSSFMYVFPPATSPTHLLLIDGLPFMACLECGLQHVAHHGKTLGG